MGLSLRGINYDVGTEYFRGAPTRRLWNRADVERDLRVIRDALHCNAVNLYGTDVARLVDGAEIALSLGLEVFLQARAVDRSKDGMLSLVDLAAREAEKLRSKGRVTLNTGCELTVFMAGFLPGRDFMRRLANLAWSWPLLPVANLLLRQHLKDVALVAREAFSGPITYSAAPWERVNWQFFDIAAMNLYRDAGNARSYTRQLRRHLRRDGPLVITEFGCCSFEGAAEMGGSGWSVIDHTVDPPQLKPGIRRNEQVQADEVGKLIDLFSSSGVHGAFVYEFLDATNRTAADPRLDVDAASYGIVKVMPAVPGESTLRWERKLAFEAIARRYLSET